MQGMAVEPLLLLVVVVPEEAPPPAPPSPPPPQPPANAVSDAAAKAARPIFRALRVTARAEDPVRIGAIQSYRSVCTRLRSKPSSPRRRSRTAETMRSSPQT